MSSPAVAYGRVYAFGVHDVAVINVRSSKTVVGQGFSASINVTVYANTTSIASQTVTLTSGNSTTITPSHGTQRAFHTATTP